MHPAQFDDLFSKYRILLKAAGLSLGRRRPLNVPIAEAQLPERTIAAAGEDLAGENAAEDPAELLNADMAFLLCSSGISPRATSMASISFSILSLPPHDQQRKDNPDDKQRHL